MTPPEKLLVTIVTYNELENLPDLVRRIQEIVPHADLLVVDDNSPDGTGRWAAQQAATDERIRCLHRPRKMGIGSAALNALSYAVDGQYTLVISLDADGSHDPRFIPLMLEQMRSEQPKRPDLVIGSRYVPGGRTIGWPLYRRWMSRGVNTFARVMLGLPVRDCSGAYRCIRVAALERLELASLRSQGYSVFEEILWRSRRLERDSKRSPSSSPIARTEPPRSTRARVSPRCGCCSGSGCTTGWEYPGTEVLAQGHREGRRLVASGRGGP